MHLLTVEALVPQILQDYRMLDAGVRIRALSLRADTLKRFLYERLAVGIEPTTHLFIETR